MAGSFDGFAYYHSALSKDVIKKVFEGRGSNADTIIASICPSSAFQSSPSSSAPTTAPVSNPQPLDTTSQQQNDSSPPSSSPFDSFNSDPCRCTEDGWSGDVFTDVIGCSIKAFFGDLCYIVDPSQCPEAFPSTNFAGAAYRRCD